MPSLWLLPVEACQYRAFVGRAMFTLIDEAAQSGFHRGKGFDFTFYVGNLRCSASAYISALLLWLNAQRQQFSNFIEREAQLLGAFYKSQPLRCFRWKLAIPGLSARSLLQQTSALVIPDCFEIDG